MSRIVYLSNARLPTEKAHGFQVMKMCEGMARLGHEVELMHPWRRQPDAALSGADPFAYYGMAPSFEVTTLPNRDVLTLERRLPGPAMQWLYRTHQLTWGRSAARRAQQAGPDLIYTRDPGLAYAVSRLGAPCIFEAHVPPTPRRAPLIRRLAGRPSVRAVVALSEAVAADLEAAGVPASKLRVVPNGTDLSAFEAAPGRDDARALLGLPGDRPIIGYIGRFVAVGLEKGVPDLIAAMAVPELRALDPLLVCVGGPMDVVPGYMELARAAGVPASSIVFRDRVANPEVPLWLAALDVGAMPYPRESAPIFMSPLKLFEYMGAGLPIVATDLPAVRSVLDARNAALVPPDDPDSLGRALAGLLLDPGAASALGARARSDAAQYTWERRAERVLDGALAPPRDQAEPRPLIAASHASSSHDLG